MLGLWRDRLGAFGCYPCRTVSRGTAEPFLAPYGSSARYTRRWIALHRRGALWRRVRDLSVADLIAAATASP